MQHFSFHKDKPLSVNVYVVCSNPLQVTYCACTFYRMFWEMLTRNIYQNNHILLIDIGTVDSIAAN